MQLHTFFVNDCVQSVLNYDTLLNPSSCLALASVHFVQIYCLTLSVHCVFSVLGYSYYRKVHIVLYFSFLCSIDGEN